VVSDNCLDVTSADVPSPSIDRARYWFDQYRYASDWENRLIRAIRELSADRGPARPDLE
jgi:hypothetical protein